MEIKENFWKNETTVMDYSNMIFTLTVRKKISQIVRKILKNPSKSLKIFKNIQIYAFIENRLKKK